MCCIGIFSQACCELLARNSAHDRFGRSIIRAIPRSLPCHRAAHLFLRQGAASPRSSRDVLCDVAAPAALCADGIGFGRIYAMCADKVAIGPICLLAGRAICVKGEAGAARSRGIAVGPVSLRPLSAVRWPAMAGGGYSAAVAANNNTNVKPIEMGALRRKARISGILRLILSVLPNSKGIDQSRTA